MKKKRRRNRMTTSKKMLYWIFGNCTVVEIYSMIAMWAKNDLSSLSTLISAVIGECVGYAVYSIKATRENSVGGITYEKAAAAEFTDPSDIADPSDIPEEVEK